MLVDLVVYEVATRDRNGQFSFSIRHTADEMAVGGILRPVTSGKKKGFYRNEESR